jgi:16S rRNA (cytidine1402-2'-O)-methyltransferase
MPLNPPTDESRFLIEPGVLYIVSTPIGNREDITLRALAVLKQVDIIAAEDTRHTRSLLGFYHISTQLVSCHDFNESERAVHLIGQLKNGKSVALVSDAGTPLLSDPGHRVVKAAIKTDITVVPIPGASAALAGLSISGLATDSFVFLGFPPRKKSTRHAWIDNLKSEARTQILYESPQRIISLLQDLQEILGDRNGVLCRELTKIHEEVVRGPISGLISNLMDRSKIRGEITLILAGCGDSTCNKEDCLEMNIQDMITMNSERLPDLAKDLAKRFGITRKEAYDRIRQTRLSD